MVARSACPNSSWMVRLSVLRCNWRVAKLSLKLCALITLVNPTRRAATLIAMFTTAGSTCCRRTSPLRGSVDTSRAGNQSLVVVEPQNITDLVE